MQEKQFCYKFPRPSVTSDCVVFCTINGKRNILLIKRKNPPFQNSWAFPGGFLDEGETLEQCAIRELEEETGIIAEKVDFFAMADKPDRDPRGRVISAIYYTFFKNKPACKANDDALELAWFPIDNLPSLAFDHTTIISELIIKLDEIL